MAQLRDLHLADGRVLSKRLLSLRFAGAGGPGGQHVNRTATKVDLRLDLARAGAVLGKADVRRLRARLASRLDAHGNLRIVSRECREQGRNVEVALERMEWLISRALARRKPRLPTKPTRGSHERRLIAKKRRGRLKRLRTGVRHEL